MDDIELLKRLAEAAAQGEYESKQDWDDCDLYDVLAPTELRVKAGPVMKTVATCNTLEQAEFFAAANPSAVLALIAEVEAQRKAKGEARRAAADAEAAAMGMMAERDRLKAEIEQMRKDAERYRWLVDNGYFRCVSVYMDSQHAWTGAGRSIPAKAPTLDEAIDAAMGDGERNDG